MHNIPQEIFKAYDIRGVVDTALSVEVVTAIGHAIGSEAKARNLTAIAIGRDGRLSGPSLTAALAKGIQQSGIDVVDVETFENSDKTRISGLEFSIDYTASSFFMIRSGFSFIDAKSTESDFTDSTPDWSAFVLSQYQFGNRHRVSGALYYIDDMIWLDTQDRTSSINKLDLRYSYLIDKDSETRIELIGQNMLEEYTDYLSENTQERLYLLRISGGF